MDGRHEVEVTSKEVIIWTGDKEPLLVLPYNNRAMLLQLMKTSRSMWNKTCGGLGPWVNPAGRRDHDRFPYTRQIAELIDGAPLKVAKAALIGTSNVPAVYPVTRTQLLQEFLGAGDVSVIGSHLVIDNVEEPWRIGALALIEAARDCGAIVSFGSPNRPRSAEMPLGKRKRSKHEKEVRGARVFDGWHWRLVNGFVVSDITAFWLVAWPRMISQYLSFVRFGDRNHTRKQVLTGTTKEELVKLATDMKVVPGELCSRTQKPITDPKRIAKRRRSFQLKLTRPIKYTGCAERMCPPHGAQLTLQDIEDCAGTVTAKCPVAEADRVGCGTRKYGNKPKDVLAAAIAAKAEAPPCVQRYMASAGDKQRFAGAAMFRVAYEMAKEL